MYFLETDTLTNGTIDLQNFNYQTSEQNKKKNQTTFENRN